MPATRNVARRRQSLERRLPLLMTGVLVAVLGTALAVTYTTLLRSEFATRQDRLRRAAHQITIVGEAGIRQSRSRYLAVANDTAIRRALSAAARGGVDTVGVHDALGRLTVPTDSGMPVELWDTAGRRVAFVGTDLRSEIAVRAGASELRDRPVPHMGIDSVSPVDSLHLGKLYASGQRVHFWIVMPVLSHGAAVGYLAQQRRIGSGPQTLRTLRELSGDSVSAYFRNADGSLWASVGGAPADPPQFVRTGRDSSRARPQLGELLSYEERMGLTPWMLVMELPRRMVFVRPREQVTQLLMVSVLLVLVGTGFSWAIGRRIAHPLGDLTRAAESIARGDYATRVPSAGHDEIVRLADSFNNMAGEIGTSRAALERQTTEARTIALQLTQTNSRLESALTAVAEREAQLRALADAIPQLAWIAETNGESVWYNQRWYEYTGTTTTQVIGWGWQVVHDTETFPTVLERWRRSLESGEPFEMEMPLRAADGRFRWFLTRIEPLRDSGESVTRWFGTSTDVQALRDAREEAAAANRAKTDFLATMSHELRTPLNAIGGYVELLEMGLRGPVTDAQLRDLERIRASQQHLLGLIGGVLDLSRIESGRIQYELAPISLEPFLAGLDALVAPQAATKRLALEHVPCESDLAAIADREKLRQILLNLLSNAIRYTPAGGRVTLEATALDATTVRMTVRDTGPGIPEGRQEQIFEPFVQLDRSLTQSRDGVGLGLAISRDLARGMGGDLSVESRGGAGSCFVLTLPRGVAEAGRAPVMTGEMPIVRA